MRLFRAIALLVCLVPIALAQGTTSTLDGNVTDPQGAAVVGARIEVTNINTGQVFRTASDERGHWALPSMQAAVYRLSAALEGFRSAVVQPVTVNSGVPATVNVKLELGQLVETVEVIANAEILQTATAAVHNTITGRQVFELPFTSRNALELLVTQPGTQTPTDPRSSTVNGLPRGALNITIDGLNTQDTYYKSGDGFFSYIFAPADAIEEVTLTTSAGGADSLGQGAAQVKFVTKSGTNEYHGGTFWQHRNTVFNSNYYFNNINGRPRDRIILNQGGVHVGGPILKDKLFFFVNYEIYRLPNTYNFTRQILGDDARKGIFTYQDSVSKEIRKVDLYQLAAGGNALLGSSVRPYPTTPDPILASTFDQIAKLSANGTLRSRVATNNDYNRNDLLYQPTSMQKRSFLTSRIDLNVTDKHTLSLVYNFDKYLSLPDGLNSVVPIYPGTGIVLGSDLIAGQRSNRFAGTLSLRSAVSARFTNELQTGLNGGTVLFRDTLAPGYFNTWKGYVPNFGGGWISGVTSTSSPSRRNSPLKHIADTVSWVRGAHQLGFGGSFDDIRLWAQSIGTQLFPSVRFQLATGDPINTGSTGIFTTKNFPNATSTQLSDARNLYAILTGRVSEIGRQVTLDEKTKKYGAFPAVNRDLMREYGLFAQDTWKVMPGLTLTLGMRYERQSPFENLSGTYTRVGIEGLYGLSGVGNLFQPGTLTGVVPDYKKVTGSAYRAPSVWAPSLGIAWQLPKGAGPLRWLLGDRKGAAVIRAGYAISTIRESTQVFTSIWGSNTGRNYDASISPTTFPADFGAAGSVLFRDASLPTRSGLPSEPSYPIPVNFTSSLNDFHPNLKMGYVQSWNIGFQRELGQNFALEVRYTGNHGVHEWRQYNLNELNIYENKFLDEFKIAKENLRIAREKTPGTNNFGNQGLPGQQNLKILPIALGSACCTDTNTATYLYENRAGSLASSISGNATRLGNLTSNGYPANFFVVNPTVAGGDSWIVTNDGSSFYHALQVELTHRLSKGLLVQGSYAWARALANGATNRLVVDSQPTTLRNLKLDRVESGYDIRHAFKLNWIYELPFGPRKTYLSDLGNPLLRKALEGWEIAGVSRIQSGTPSRITSGRAIINAQEGGVILYNMTRSQLQDAMKLRKTTGADGLGIVYCLPDAIIQNTRAAFEVGGKTLKDLDPKAPYIGPSTAPGQLGYNINLAGPWQRRLDVSLVKITTIKERANIEFRAQALNVLNLTNFYMGSMSANSTAFGQVTSAYRDTSGTVDPGGRIIEFVLRFNF